ncbi:TRAP transporter substrate-binding protein [Enterocloster aldenensis]|uniref:TRAP transporter substrate-binding protein n=1 Tax=Enterocloster aldenensis TaxID=358742 RepID=UPI0025A49B19|nr:TRAP transporter substrate-binding protein [Enterocloster aldenensis]
MKKTLFAITMAAFTAMSLAACGSGSGKTDTTAAAGTEAAKEAGDAKKEETGAPAAAASGDSIKLTWSEVNGEDYGATVGAKEFAKKIEELSGGQITVELYLNGTLGNEKESMQGIQMGTLDIFRGNASSLSNYGADKISLSGLPFLFKDMDQFQEMAVSSLGQELLASVDEADCGYVALGWLTEGPRHMFITENTYKKLGSPSEFSLDMMNGLKMRVPETDLMVNTMTALKASATPIAYSELYTSLQSGVVDGAENDVINYMANSYNEVAPYFIPDAHTFGCGVILMNKDRWNSMTEEQQGWMKEAAEAAGRTCYEYNQEKIQATFDSFEEKGVTKLEVVDLDKWSEACESVYSSYDADSQAIIEKIRNAEY